THPSHSDIHTLSLHDALPISKFETRFQSIWKRSLPNPSPVARLQPGPGPDQVIAGTGGCKKHHRDPTDSCSQHRSVIPGIVDAGSVDVKAPGLLKPGVSVG